MATSRFRYVTLFFCLIILSLILLSVIFYSIHRRKVKRIPATDSCPRPEKYLADYDFDYRKNSREFQNVNQTVDSFRLSLSWSPTFCAKKKNSDDYFQCQQSFKFIVHGLWPNNIHAKNLRAHPRNCRNEQQIPLEIIQKYFCLMPSEVLMQAEWEKHGTCYWQKPEDYFEQIKRLHSKIILPTNIESILNNQTITKRLRAAMIKQSFRQLNSDLPEDAVEIRMIHRGRKLSEVAFCYDQNFGYVKCH